MEINIKRNKLYVSFNLFILCILLLTCCAFAECGDCDDGNPCTKDACINATRCEHIPQDCDKSSSASVQVPQVPTPGPDSTAVLTQAPIDYSEKEPTAIEADQNEPANAAASQGGLATTNANPDATEKTAIAPESIAMDLTIPNGTAPETISGPEQTALETIAPIGSDENVSVVCDDSNNCAGDSPGESSCTDGTISCDDGNDSTVDSCTPSGCVNTPACNECGNSIQEPSSGPDQAGLEPNETVLENGINPDVIEPIISVSGENNSTEAFENMTAFNSIQDNGIHNCDDNNPCTEDYFNGTACEHKMKDCDDGNDSTYDYCYEGECYHTASKCDDGDPCTTDSFNGKECVHTLTHCDDGNPCTIDICDNGKCSHVPKNCDDGNPCTYDRCNSQTGCYHPSKCDDGDPCTVDYCDSVSGCYHSPKVCYDGKTCINGVCQYPYYDYVAPYVAPTSATSAPQSYTIPAGTVVTVPWGQSMTALGALQVNNGLAYPSTSPLRFARLLGYETKTMPAVQIGMSQATGEEAEMIGLSWKDSSFKMTLVQPNGTALPASGDGINVIHVSGTTYDYYFLKQPARGSWYIDIAPISPASTGAAYSLISGQVKGTLPENQV